MICRFTLITGFLESGKDYIYKFYRTAGVFSDEEPTLLIACEEGRWNMTQAMLLKHNTVLEVLEDPEELPGISSGLSAEVPAGPGDPGIQSALGGQTSGRDGPASRLGHCPAHRHGGRQNLSGLYEQHEVSFLWRWRGTRIWSCSTAAKRSSPWPTSDAALRWSESGCEILFEVEEGELTDIFEDEVPYDLKADVIEIEDMDYWIIYVDMRDHPERYQGRTVKFKGNGSKKAGTWEQLFRPAAWP